MLSVYSFIAAPEWRHYATAEDASKAADIYGRYKDREPELAWQIEKELNYGQTETPKRKRLTIEDLENHLKARGIQVRRNLISHRVEFDGWNRDGEFSRELEAEQLPVILHDELADGYSGSKPEDIARFLAVIAGKHEFNPVLDLLKAEPWDGVNRLPELYDILGVTDSFSQTLIEKWMRQALALQYNDIVTPFGGEGVLVLTGPQGCGKSLFSAKLGDLTGTSGLFLPGALLDPQDKDSVIQATGRWIVEIGELGATFNRADMGRLKAFLTKPFDTYRVPFGREEISTLRRTSFIATVDRVDFLSDDSGERRWWVVEVEKINLDALDKLDRIQLWRQVLALVSKDGVNSFRLTREERDRLNARNAKHEKMIPAEQELLDILAQYRGEIGCEHKFGNPTRMSASQIAADYDLKYTAAQIGRALNKIGVESGRTNGATWYVFPPYKRASTSVFVKQA